MADVIPAAKGWRYVYWESEFGGMCALPIVAWAIERYTTTPDKAETKLVPLVLGYEQLGVAEPPERAQDAFVVILTPGDELHDFAEAGEQVEQELIRQEEAEEHELSLKRARLEDLAKRNHAFDPVLDSGRDKRCRRCGLPETGDDPESDATLIHKRPERSERS